MAVCMEWVTVYVVLMRNADIYKACVRGRMQTNCMHQASLLRHKGALFQNFRRNEACACWEHKLVGDNAECRGVDHETAVVQSGYRLCIKATFAVQFGQLWMRKLMQAISWWKDSDPSHLYRRNCAHRDNACSNRYKMYQHYVRSITSVL